MHTRPKPNIESPECNESRLQSAHPMDRCLPELWTEICAFACTDDGSTGRSLSLVPRFFNESSKLYKLQSLIVIGLPQLQAFADLLERTPPHLRCVRYIFISTHHTYIGGQPGERHPFFEERRPLERSRLYSGREMKAIIKRVLRGIAPSVQVLHYLSFALASRSRMPAARFPVSMPMLEELVVHGRMKLPKEVDDVQFVALKRFRAISEFHDLRLMFTLVLKKMPNLTHLALR